MQVSGAAARQRFVVTLPSLYRRRHGPAQGLHASRRALATSQYLLPHGSSSSVKDNEAEAPSSAKCAHYFLDPLSWMRPELEQGKLDGRLECPKCRTNVGKYAWQGMQCSCGDWVVPAITLSKARIDESLPGRTADGIARNMASLGIRHPPREPGKESL